MEEGCWELESSVPADEVLLLEDEVTESRVLSPARLMVVVYVLLVRTAVCDTEAVASPCRRVVSGLSSGRVLSSVNSQGLASRDTAWEMPGIWFVLVISSQSLLLLLLLLLASLVLMRVEVSGSADRFVDSGDPLLVSVKVFVCSVSVDKEQNGLYCLIIISGKKGTYLCFIC